MLPIQKTEAVVRYGPRGGSYYNKEYDLKNYGVKRYPYSDVDILELISTEKYPKNLRFHKVRDYVNQTILQFYIYNVDTNLLVCTMFVLLDKQRLYFETPDITDEFPNMDVKIEVIQDPNNRPYLWTGEYW